MENEFSTMMEAIKTNSEDPTLSPEVREYAKSVFMTMQALQEVHDLRELEEVNAMFPPQ